MVTAGNAPLTKLFDEYRSKGFGYAGVELYQGGALTARKMIEAGHLKAGDKALVYGLLSQGERGQRPAGSRTRWRRPGSRSTISRSART